MKYLLPVGALLLTSLWLPLADAKVMNPSVELLGDNQLRIDWDALSDDEAAKGFRGYGVQWSESLSDLDSDDSMRQVLSGLSNTSVDIYRYGIGSGDTHYFRVHAYFEDSNGKKVYTHGSDVVNFVWYGDNTKTSSIITKNELTLDPTTYTPASTGDEDTDTTADDYTFPKMTLKRYDTFIIAQYSRPFDVPKTYLDGYFIEVATDAAFQHILTTATVNGADLTSVRVNGLTPQTKYYLRGYFYQNKNGQKTRFGKSSTEEVVTQATLTESQKTRLDMLRRRGSLSLDADVTVHVGGEDAAESYTDSALPSSDVTLTADSDRFKKALASSNMKEVEAEIIRLQKQIQELRRRLVSLRNTTRSQNVRSTSSTTGTTAVVTQTGITTDADDGVRKTSRSFETWARYRQ
ncbi:hypothetical protein H6771_00220 [Candidatus Peribacteria bacterium]|nr:hypothetical protein [Candidatus Peribacteria bacterium]